MINRVPDKQQSSIVKLLNATAKAKGDRSVVYPILEENLDQLQPSFALQLKEFASSQVKTLTPQSILTLGSTLVWFGYLVQQFPQGNRGVNLQIAIASYESALNVFQDEQFHEQRAKCLDLLKAATQQHQQLLAPPPREEKQPEVKPTPDEKIVPDPLKQELLKTQQQVEHLKGAIARLEESASNPAPPLDITPIVSSIQSLKPRNLCFNTAIFYDIENLVMGNRKPKFLFSLTEIIEKIQQLPEVQKIAIQCAYANWSDPRLGKLRNDILDLGIEPIQIFGFSQQKNAADIQLAIDVVELIHHRAGIEVFAIVSGDGAFASLANKLHQYGKTVIACAYEQQINRVFKSVCDWFIPVADTQEIVETKSIDAELNGKEVDLISLTRQKLKLLKQDQQFSLQLKQGGVPIPQIHIYLSKHIDKFERRRQSEGYGKLIRLLKNSLPGTELALSTDNNAITYQNIANVVENSSKLENSHLLNQYRKILKTGEPEFDLPDPNVFKKVIQSFVQHYQEGETFQKLSERLKESLGEEFSKTSINRTLKALLSAGCFQKNSNQMRWHLHPCCLNPECDSEQAILDTLQISMRQKLLGELQQLDEEIFQQIIPSLQLQPH